jgi:superfamily II DNA or RNA helicase
MSDIHLQYVNSVQCRVVCDPGILMELSDHLTFFKKNYKFDPKYKARIWDGKIRMVNRLTRVVYAGLSQRIKKFCDARDYTFSFDDEFAYDNVSVKEVQDFIVSLNLPDWLEIREYQVDAVVKCLRSKRRTLLSPTSSGKSLIIYVINEWYRRKFNTKSLIIVPTIGLVKQMQSDFESYGYTGTFNTSVEGLDKSNDHQLDSTITTWQSLDNGKTKIPKQWFAQFNVVFGDEAHGCAAASLIKILSALDQCTYRFGTTGTLDDDQLNKATIEGLFGPVYKTTSTRELIDQGYAADLKIKCIVLKYPEAIRKEFHKSIVDPKTKQKRKRTYHEEIEYLINYQSRTDFVKNLALSLKGNKLVFFRLTDHGDILYNSLKEHTNVFYIDGSVKGEDREKIRQAIEVEENAILVASLGTTSTGVSINRLHHMIAASPSKSKIKVLQSIGRMLRQHEEKTHAVLYDIVDDLSYGKQKNFTLQHFEERAKIYDKEQFEYSIYTVGLK